MDHQETQEPSEHDLTQERLSPPAEPEAMAGVEVSPSPEPMPAEPMAEEEPASDEIIVHAPPLEPAAPGVYWCEEEYSGSHPVLQQTIHQGENDLTAMTNPDDLMAVAALVRDGVLRLMAGETEKSDERA
jgi:hypothetical protein